MSTESKSRTRTQFQLVREMTDSKYDEVTISLKETIVVQRGKGAVRYGLTPAQCMAIGSFCLMVGIDCYFNEKPVKGEVAKRHSLADMVANGEA